MSKERAAQLVDAGIWLKLSGDLEGAKKLFQRALKLDPANEQAQRMLDAPAEAGAATSTGPENPFALGGVPQVPPVEKDWSTAGLTDSTDPEIEHEQTGRFGEDPHRAPSAEDWGSMTGQETTDPNSPSLAAMAPPMARPSGLTIVLGDNADAEPEKIRSTPPIFQGASDTGSHSAVTSQVTAYVPRSTPTQFDKAGALAGKPSTGGTPQRPVPSLFVSDAEAGATTSQVPAYQPVVPPPAPDPALEVVIEATASPEPEAEKLADNADGEAFAPSVPKSRGSAWDWSGGSPAPTDPDKPAGTSWPEDAPVPPPRPSPALAPHAQSAWDAKSNPGIKLNALVGEARALELIETNKPVLSSSPSSIGPRGEVKALLRGARDLLDLDDHSGAMELILKAQVIAPDDPDVEALRLKSEKTLLAMFESKLGDLAKVPRVLLKDDEIIWLNLDHRAGFVLAQIDGTVSFDDLFAVSGMSRLDTARIIAQLIDEGVITGR